MSQNIKKRVFWGGVSAAILGGVFLSGWALSFASQALAENLAGRLNRVENPIARTLLAKFLPTPNMLAEDHVRLSCEPNFSVKVFTQATLSDVVFVVKNAEGGAVLYGPKTVDKLNPLWQTVPLGPMSSIPPKILVLLDAKSSDGKAVHDELVLEPDCEKAVHLTNLVNKVTVLWPKGKFLFNPPPLDPTRPRLVEIPVTVVVPKEMVGQSLVAAVLWRDPDTLVKRYTYAEVLETIPTEIIQLSLQSVSPITVITRPDGASAPASSFFDVFVEISIGEPAGSQLPGVIKYGALSLPEVSPDDHVIHPDGTKTFITGESTFAEVFFDILPLRLIDATPLETTRATAGDGTTGAETSTSNPFPFN